MVTFLIISAMVFSVLSVALFSARYKIERRKKVCKEWKVGDKLISDSLVLDNLLSKSGQEYLILSGCNEEHVFVQIGDSVYVRDWKDIKMNKSSNWREYYRKCEEAMGVKPGFSKEVGEDKGSDTIDGKPIETLNEIECQIYLKKCLDEEKYELAQKIREQMKKYR